MKITFVLPFAGLFGGVRVVAVYANALAARGHDVQVVSQPAEKPSIRQRIRAFRRGEKLRPPVASPLFRPLGTRHRILERARPVTAADLDNADFIVATWWETAEWIRDLPAAKGRKLYLLQDYEMFPYLPVERVAATFHAGLHMLAVSSYIRDTIRQNHGVDGIDVILNGVDTDQFSAPPRAKQPFRIGFLYQRDPRKNMPLAIEVVEKIRARLPDVEIVAFGNTLPGASNPLPEGVAFEHAPSQTRIPEIYGSCDAWLFTSEHEGFGLPLLEAMACRTPVLATPAGAARDIIRDGENGWVLPFEADAFVEKLVLMHDMPDADRAAMATAARDTALSWGWDTRVDTLEDMLFRIAREHPMIQAIPTPSGLPDTPTSPAHA